MNLDDIISLEDDLDLDDPQNSITDDDSKDDDPSQGLHKDPKDDSTDDDSAGNGSNDDDPQVDDSAVEYFEYLKSSGVLALPEDYEFDGTADGIEEALELTKKNLANGAYQNIWNSLPEDFKPLLDYALRGGKSLDEYINTFSNNSLENLDLSDIDNQRTIIEKYYKMMNPTATQDKVNKWVSRREEIGDLEEEAKDALEYIKDLKEEEKANFLKNQELKAEAEKKAAEKAAENLKAAIASAPEMDQLRKNRIQQLFFTPRSEVSEFDQKLDSIYENPQHLIQLGDILADYDPRLGFTFDRLKKRLKTESNKKFSDLIKTKVDSKSNVSGTIRSTADDFDLEKWMINK